MAHDVGGPEIDERHAVDALEDVADAEQARAVATLGEVWAIDAAVKNVAANVTTSGATMTVELLPNPDTLYPTVMGASTTIPRGNWDYERRDGSTYRLRARGYLARSAIMQGYPCFSGDAAATAGHDKPSGRFRAECTAQAHAIRKLNQIHRDEPGDFRPTADVQWEVGPSNDPCPDEVDENCESVDTGRWRADIVHKSLEQSRKYLVLEAKRYSTSVWEPVHNQINAYIGHLNTLNIEASKSARLQEVYDRGWAVSYMSLCWDRGGDDDQRYSIAWVPRNGDPGFTLSDAQYAGHIYFDDHKPGADYNVDDKIVDRAKKKDADKDYQGICHDPSEDCGCDSPIGRLLDIIIG